MNIHKKVSYSSFSKILTIVVSILLVTLCVKEISVEIGKGILGAAMLAVILIFSLLYAPLSVTADEDYLVVRRPLKRKVIPLADIISVRYAPPTMADKRSCASGGFMGYWGWFSNKMDGNYFGYYGKSSDTFLIELRNGRRYMIGCDDSGEVADFISANLKEK